MQPDNLDDLNRLLRAQTAQHNNTPLEDFLGLSPAQMSWLNRSPLQEGSVLRWQDDIPVDVLAEVPLLHFAVDLLERLSEKEIKLTAKGNLPRKRVLEWYATGRLPQYDIEHGITKISSQDDYHAATIVKYVVEMLRWTKKRHGKLSITAAGKKALKGKRQAMLESLFGEHLTKFNLGYFDSYPEAALIQFSYGFLLYVLLRDGTEWRNVSHYTDRLLTAMPMLIDEFTGARFSTPKKDMTRLLNTRIFERTLGMYGLTRFKGERKISVVGDVMATDLFRQLFRVDADAQRPSSRETSTCSSAPPCSTPKWEAPPGPRTICPRSYRNFSTSRSAPFTPKTARAASPSASC